MTSARLGLRLAAAVCFGPMVACSTAPSLHAVDVITGQSIELRKAPLAEQRHFAGRYFSAQLGWLRLSEEGPKIEGSYFQRTCGCLVQGRLSGESDQNSIEFEWQETVSGCTNAERRDGRGNAFYRAPPELTRPGKLFGKREYRVTEQENPDDVAHHVFRGSDTWTAVAVDDAAPFGADDAAHCP